MLWMIQIKDKDVFFDTQIRAQCDCQDWLYMLSAAFDKSPKALGITTEVGIV